MKLTELMIAIAIFLIACVVFTGSLINVRRSVSHSEVFSKEAVVLLDVDARIRNELKKISIPFWGNFDLEFEKAKIGLQDRLMILEEEKGFEITEVSSIHNVKYGSEGIKVRWIMFGKEYECQEFIKQRIINGD